MKSKLPTKPTVQARGFLDLISLFYSAPGVGKSTFVNGLAKRVFFLSTDRGTRNIKTMRAEVFSWKGCLKVLDQLEDDDAPHYDIICIDHVADWSTWAEDYTCKRLNVESLTDKSLPWGKGWREYKKEIRQYIQRIMAMNTAVVFTAHEVIKTVKERGLEKDQRMPNLGKSAWDLLIPSIDIVGFAYMGKKDKRYLQTQPNSSIYAKDRSRRKQDEDNRGPFDPEVFLSTFEKQKEDSNEQEEEGRLLRRGRLRRKGHLRRSRAAR